MLEVSGLDNVRSAVHTVIIYPPVKNSEDFFGAI
jgi:hypothetical protein